MARELPYTLAWSVMGLGWEVVGGSYLVLGLFATAAMFWWFPPTAGHRPSLRLRILAVASFTIFWPVVVLLCAWSVLIESGGEQNRPHANDQHEPEPDEPGSGPTPLGLNLPAESHVKVRPMAHADAYSEIRADAPHERPAPKPK